MPYRAFCDRCQEETPKNYVSNRAILTLDGWKAEVMLAQERAWSHGILCEKCLLLLLREGTLSQQRTIVPIS